MYEAIISYENLLLAWREFKRGKSGRVDVDKFELVAERELYKLAGELQQGGWQHGVYSSFVVHDPKRRVVYKARVIDRILHRAIVRIISPYFEQKFVYHSFASRNAKGSLAALEYLEKQMRKISGNNSRTVWVIKLDIKKYFYSIDTTRLLLQISKYIRCKKTLWLLEEVIQSYDQTHLAGLPLGNETSQLFANLYLHKVDCFVLHKIKPNGYMRYMDDMLVIGKHKNELGIYAKALREYLWSDLRLQLHWPVQPETWASGIDTMGYVSFPYFRRLRTRTKRRIELKLADRINEHQQASLLGLCKHAREYRLTKKINIS